MTEKSQFASLQESALTQNRDLQWWPLDRLKPYPGNARTHPRAQVSRLAGLIEKLGFASPIIARPDGTIAAGHARLEAAKLLGLEVVPVVVMDGWTDEQFRAFVIADNQAALDAGWDEDLLAAELKELASAKFDLDLLGFDTEALARALAPSQEPLADPDDAPPVPVVPVSQKGDLWILGEHRLSCGDATNLQDAERLLGGERAAMCFTDPPYNVDYANSQPARRKGKARPILNDALGADFGSFLQSSCETILSNTDGAIYIAMSSAELDTLQRAFREAGGKWSTFVIWAKNTFTLGRSDYQRQYEPILYGWRDGGRHHWAGSRDQGDVWFYDKTSRSDAHPTMKPVALVERAIVNSSKAHDIVFDPFGGSGTTLIAAWRSGRRARLIELDPKYVDVIVRRWQKLTGQSAVLEDTGQTFQQIESQRLHQKVA